jgi:short-subunit dehydrogenase
MDLKGSTAIVTGASRGLGREIAHRLAKEGVRLLLAGRSVEGLETVRAELVDITSEVYVLAVDLSQAAQARHLIETAYAVFGQLDILINNAAVIEPEDYEKVDPVFIEKSIALNLTAPMLLTRFALPTMLASGHGHIVNIASLSGLLPVGWAEVYTATKHGLVGFTRSLRATLKVTHSTLRVSLVCPGFIKDAGMYTDRVAHSGIKAPMLIGTCLSENVVKAVVRSLEQGTSEMVVANRLVRLQCAVYNIMPIINDWIVRKIGGHSVFLNYIKFKHHN